MTKELPPMICKICDKEMECHTQEHKKIGITHIRVDCDPCQFHYLCSFGDQWLRVGDWRWIWKHPEPAPMDEIEAAIATLKEKRGE